LNPVDRMAEAIVAGDGAPPAPQTGELTKAPAEQQQAEGNVSVLDYARRKLRERDQAKPAEGQAKGEAQKQPSPPKAAPESKTVLSQAAVEVQPTEGEQSAGAGQPSEEEPRQEPDTADGQSDEEALPDDAPDWMKKRMARFTRQKHELQQRLEQANAAQGAIRAELDQLKGGKAQPQPSESPLPVVVAKDDPAGHFTNEAQIDQAFDQAREVRRWCMRNPEGGTFQVSDGKGGVTEREFSAQQVMALREAAEDDIEKHLPRRKNYLRQERALTIEALQQHPWLTDTKSPRLGLVRQLLTDYPEIRLRPDWARASAIFVRGLELVQHEQAEAAKAVNPPKPKPGPPPPKIPGPSPTAPRKQGPAVAAEGEIKAAEKAWSENPSQQNFARLHRARRQQQSTG
jgi:hypothetical protein